MIAFGANLATVIYLIVTAARRNEPLLVGNPSVRSPHAALVKTEPDKSEVGISQRTKPQHKIPVAENARSYEVVGPTKEPLALEESVVMDRVKEGLQCLQMGSLPTEEKLITEMREAYVHLMHNASIMAGYEPLRRIEQDK